MENKVSIDMYVYDSLMKDKFKYDLLLKAIKVLEPYKYYVKQTELINLKKLEEEEATNNE